MGAEISISSDIANFLDDKTPERVESELYEIWNHLDTNQSGSLDRLEARQFFDIIFNLLRERGLEINKPDQVAAELMKHFDQDNNGEISWEEFATAVDDLFPDAEGENEEAYWEGEEEDAPKDPAEIAAKLEQEKAAKFIRSHVKFGGYEGEPFDHFAENPQIERIKKISFRCKEQLECFQVVYELSDGTEWETPVYGANLETLVSNVDQSLSEEQLLAAEQKNWVEIEIAADTENIMSLEGRASENYVNSLTFEITKKRPNGSTRLRVVGKKGKGPSQRFSIHGNLTLVGFYGSHSETGIHRLGFYFKKEVVLTGKLKRYETWQSAIEGRQLSYYYNKYFGKPGFAPPKLVDAGDIETESTVNIVLDGFKDLLTPEQSKELIDAEVFTEKDLEDDLFLVYDKHDGIVTFQTTDPLPGLPQGIESPDQLEAGVDYLFCEKGSEIANAICLLTNLLAYIVEDTIGWPVRSVKMIFATELRHNAMLVRKGKITLVEAERSTEEEAILADIADNDEIKEVFDQRYQEVKNKAAGEWKAKVEEFHKVKAGLEPPQKEEYKKEFKGYKREVHDTLQLVDFKYTLYHDRWAKLSSYKDYSYNNFHELQENLKTDEDITKELLSRGERDHPIFTKFLTDLANNFNEAKNIRELVEQRLELSNEFYYYPLNMTRYFDVKEHNNKEKLHLKIGPLKTYDRGLQKVIETKDKTGALLDVLRATILCSDPVVPLLVIEYLEEQGMLTRVKNKTGPFEEYKCVHINLTLPGKYRTIYELQVVFEEYYELQKMDHDYYEIIRVM